MTPPLGYDLLLPGPTPFSPALHASGLYPLSVHSKSKPGFDGGTNAPIRAHPRRSSTSDARSLPLAESIRLHGLLEFSPASSGDGGGPAIRWDLVDMPSLPTLSPSVSQNRRGSRRSSLSSSTDYYGHQQGLRLLDLLDEPATLPPTASVMTITSPHLLWVIRVYPSGSSSSSLLPPSSSPPSSPDSPSYSPAGSFDSSSSSFSSYVHLPGPETRYITVRDVLTEIYYTLRAPISHSEYAQLSYERDRERAGKAYKRRYRRVLSSSAGPHEDSSDDSRREREYEDEKQAGLRRVDFLMEKTRFGGLSRGRGPGEWVLHVE